MAPSAIERIRAICLTLPRSEEFISHGEPSFRVAKGRMFATFASGATHHGNGHDAVWCRSTALLQPMLVARHPGRIFVPPYVGPSGWIGIGLDGRPSWRLVRELLAEAHALATAPRRRR